MRMRMKTGMNRRWKVHNVHTIYWFHFWYHYGIFICIALHCIQLIELIMYTLHIHTHTHNNSNNGSIGLIVQQQSTNAKTSKSQCHHMTTSSSLFPLGLPPPAPVRCPPTTTGPRPELSSTLRNHGVRLRDFRRAASNATAANNPSSNNRAVASFTVRCDGGISILEHPILVILA